MSSVLATNLASVFIWFFCIYLTVVIANTKVEDKHGDLNWPVCLKFIGIWLVVLLMFVSSHL